MTDKSLKETNFESSGMRRTKPGKGGKSLKKFRRKKTNKKTDSLNSSLSDLFLEHDL